MAVVNIQLGSYSLQSSDVVTSEIQHESAPPINIDILDVPFKDGAALAGKNFTPKSITLSGKLKASSQSALDTLIDTFKLNTNVDYESLDIEYGSSFRRYKVTTASVTISRGRGDLSICGFSLKFDVINFPFGSQVSALGGSEVSNELFSFNINPNEYLINETITLGGTSPQKPLFKFTVDKPSSLESIILKNLETQQRIEINNGFASGDIITLNTKEFKLLKEGAEIDFSGVIPDFNVGNTHLQIFLKDTSSSVFLSETYNKTQAITNENKYGFEVTDISSVVAGEYLGFFEVLLSKNFGSSGQLVAELWDDSNNDGTYDTLIETIYIPMEHIGEGMSWISLSFSTYDPSTLSLTSGGYAVLMYPDNENSVINLAFRDYGFGLTGIPCKTKNSNTITLLADVIACYRIYKFISTSYWQIDTFSGYNKSYL